MTDANPFKVETPTKELDLCFVTKGNIFKEIYSYLTKFGDKINELDKKVAGIPDFSIIQKM